MAKNADMLFRLTFPVGKSDFSIGYDDNILSVGSCFAENVAERLSQSRLRVTVNPFGILYNPLSIASALHLLAAQRLFTEDDLFFSEGLYHSWMHHSRFSREEKQACLDAINSSIQAVDFKKITTVVLTLGTAWVYELKSTGRIVANCHKQKPDLFARRRISVSEAVKALGDAISEIRALNPGVRIVLTVSPVRHFKDGAHENSLSKSVLHLAVDELCVTFGCDYFPAYELLIDDLRDYRFFADDMAHPSPAAVDYVFAAFCERYFTDTTDRTASEVRKLTRSLSHRPLTSDDNYRRFVESQLAKFQAFASEHKEVDLSNDIIDLKNRMA
ncbi:MAG: GSCFA domain-containing protein [Paludibacteraceae bacterium]|nr:GSCFA domain-containing protein [Paludibacteraceae bacterium]